MYTLKALCAVLLACAGFSLPSFAYAASLMLSPADTSISVGQTVTVNVLVSSADQAMNASSGVLSFSTDVLQVVSISRASSIVSFWIQEPGFSNSAGSLNFEGVIPNPGYTGSGGRILSVTLRGKAEGVGTVRFSAGSVLANDGSGTELLSGTGSATVTVRARPVPPPVTQPAKTVEKSSTTTPAVTSTVSAQQEPAPPTETTITFLGIPVSYGFVKISWLLLNYLTVFVLFGLVGLVLYFIGKHVVRLLYRSWWLAAVHHENRKYADELLVIHKELTAEVSRLESAKVHGDLDPEKIRLLNRLATVCSEIKDVAGRLGG